MDWDDISPKGKTVQPAVGDNLESLSVRELEHRIEAFETEIARIRAELERKRAHEKAAAALFKS